MNANVNYCGVIILLRKLVASGHCTKKEAGRIAARIAKQPNCKTRQCDGDGLQAGYRGH